ncbi:transposase [Streptomyces sp. NPDC051776]|uniref:transposase n=1 Tax=Streptomyces sp. NPDC051776 TaxID=3155414 RepID=UPI0034475171
MFEEIQQRGYPGKEQIVRKYVHQLRQAFPRQDPPRRKRSVRDVTGWITRHPDRLDADDTQRLKEILTHVPALAATARHVRAFAELMNNRHGRHLKEWITAVRADQIPALQTFAAGLLQDLDAVVASLSLNYSSGAVEGHNNRIKMLKRQMFGRAKFDLLRKRVLHAGGTCWSWRRGGSHVGGGVRQSRPFMIADSVTLRGSGTESDPEPILREH